MLGKACIYSKQVVEGGNILNKVFLNVEWENVFGCVHTIIKWIKDSDKKLWGKYEAK